MMQKKVIVVALTAAIALPVSALADNANFTFYGTVDVSHDTVRTGNGTTAAVTTASPTGKAAVAGVTKQVVSSNVSKFGFKGSEDLGGGLAAIWQVEQQINIDNSSNSCAATTIPAVAAGAAAPAVTVPACTANNGIFATRNTFGGLKSDSLGTVLMGRHDTPYKLATRKLDVFADNIGDNRALLGNKSAAGFELRATDVLAYISPAFAGVTVAVATVNLTESNTNNTQKNNGALSMAVMYDAAPFYASVAHESHKLETTLSGANESANRFGFGFTQDMFTVGLVYEKTTDNLGNGALQTNLYGHTAFYVGGKVKVGNGAVKLAYGKAGQLANTTVATTVATTPTDTGASQISVGYDHNMSKRTTLYALYTKITNGQGINYGFSQNSGASSTTSGYGTTPSALSLGLKHSF